MLAGGARKRQNQAVRWGYDGPGAPQHWASLREEYAPCGKGRQQSPVDIAGYEKNDPGSLSFSYCIDAKAVRNDGRFVHIDFPAGNTLGAGRQTYQLQSAHFHSPSEHRIDGSSFAAELHLVHADDHDNLAVVGVLFRLGAVNPMMQAILDAAPAGGETAVDGFTLDAEAFLPDNLGYFRYDGSKTTPPCDEGVSWYVMREPKTISAEQVESLQTWSDGPNNRPVQPIGDREITVGGPMDTPGR